MSLTTTIEPFQASVPTTPLRPLLSAHDELWRLSGLLRQHARRSERLAAVAISKSSPTNTVTLECFFTTPEE